MNTAAATLGLTAEWGSIRHQVMIHCSPMVAWARISDLAGLSSWFTDVKRVRMDVDVTTGRLTRWVTTATGVELEEEILLVDSVARRLQYRLKPMNLITHHLATIDVLDMPDLTQPADVGSAASAASATSAGAERCLVVYSTDLAPRPLASAFGSGTGRALVSLKQQLEEGR